MSFFWFVVFEFCLSAKDAGNFAIVIQVNIPRIGLRWKTRESDDIARKRNYLAGSGKNT